MSGGAGARHAPSGPPAVERGPERGVPVRNVLGRPGVPAMAAWSFVGRFGLAMTNLSLLLFVRAETGSYALAGALSGSSLVGTAIGTVVQGRLVDRYGPARPLLALTLPYVGLGAAVVAGIATGAPAWSLAPLITLHLATQPAIAVASRSMWPHLAPPGPVREAAYGYEAISFEICWLLGPALAGLVATLFWPGSALLIAVGVTSVGAAGFGLTPAVRRQAGRGRAGDAAASGPVSATPAAPSPPVHRTGLATLLTATSGFGVGVGFVVVGVAAGTAANGVPSLAGVLLAGWSGSALAGGLIAQRRPWPRDVAVRLPLMMGAFGCLLTLPLLSGGLAVLVVTLVLAGLTLVPQITAHNALLDRLVPPGRLAEAYGWLTTAVVVPNAAGQAAAGVVIERYGHQAGFLGGAACVLPLALVVTATRRSLAPRPAEPLTAAPPVDAR